MRVCSVLALAALSCYGIAAQTQADIAYLQNGVHEIAAGPNNESLVVFGDQAFPVVAGRTDTGAQLPLIAAARFGKGRIAVMGAAMGLAYDDLKIADTGRLIVNILRWTAGEKANPKIGVFGNTALTARLRGLPGELKIDARNIQLSERSSVDVVVLFARNIAPQDVAPLEDYIRGGGGLVAGGAGSITMDNVHVGDFATELPANRLAAAAGIVWGRTSVNRTGPQGFRVEPPAELMHAGRALTAFVAGESGNGKILSFSQRAQIYATLERAIWDLPHDSPKFFPGLDGVLEPFLRSAVPTAAAPIARADLPWRLAIIRQTQQLRWTPTDQVRAHPAAADFPGAVPPDAQRDSATVRIAASEGRWGALGTGLYAAPGEVVTIRVPEALAGRNLRVVIDLHTDEIWHLNEWSRMPSISVEQPIRAAETRVASAFGGPIYIGVPPASGLDDFDVTISGAVRAPRYIDGKTTIGEWRDSIRSLPAPWAEIESDKIALSVPSRYVRDLDDPAALMSVWNRIMDLESEFAGVPKTRKRAERMMPDLEISAGILHSGYPIMMYMPKAQMLVNRRQLLSGSVELGDDYNRGVWGFPHELGHQMQFANQYWNFEGSIEPGANLFALYVMEKLCGIPVAEYPTSSAEFRAQYLARYFANPSFARWKDEQWYGTTTLVELQQAFGWEAFQGLFAQFRTLAPPEWPKTDDEKRDQWMVRFSRQVKRNLGPFFETWGVPTSEKARASVADLPPWMPDELTAAARKK
jgi:hypothetical protein